jgi:hypothetical protein
VGILQLKTSLKSLRYGQDLPGGGSSNEPYIQTDINNAGDGLSISSIDPAITDTIRIGKFFTDPSKGPVFLAKQVGLQLSNPRLETLQNNISNTGVLGIIDEGLNFVNNVLGPTRVYNLGVNTLAQVAVSNLGGHIVRHGILPVISDQDKYAYIVKQNDLNGANRLLRLTSQLLPDPTNLIIDSYFGGPKSTYGIGNTIISRYDTTNNPYLQNYLLTLGDAKVMLGLSGINYGAITPISDLFFSTDYYQSGSFEISKPLNDLTIGANYTNDTSTIEDNTNTLVNQISNLNSAAILIVDSSNPLVRSKLNNIGSNIAYTTGSIGYTNTYGETLIFKQTWRTGNRETRVGSGRQDQLNLFSLFTQYASSTGGVVVINGQQKSIRDFVKFRIEAIDNDDPTKFVGMVFRAYLSGFSDNYNPEWSEVKYNGRADSFDNYTGFKRQIDFKFKVAALSSGEMMPMYQKLNYLVANTSPDYNNNLMRGPLIKLTLGNWLISQPGRITSLSYNIPDDSPWEIALDQPEGGNDVKMYELPHVIEVSIGFRPFHNFLPQKSALTPYIIDKPAEGSDPRNPWLNKYLVGAYSQQELAIMNSTSNYQVS